jgi:hypothetical protein
MLQSDQHINIFHSYAQGRLTDFGHQRVLEDNITRALIAVLAHSTIPTLTKDFLKEVVGVDSRCEKFHFDLQIPKNRIILKALDQTDVKKVLLGITPHTGEIEINFPETLLQSINRTLTKRRNESEKELGIRKDRIRTALNKVVEKFESDSSKSNDLHGELSKILTVPLAELSKLTEDSGDLRSRLNFLYELSAGSRPDAWICGDNELIVLIENKIQGPLIGPQLERHKREWLGPNLDKVKCVSVRWSEILKFFKKIRAKHSDFVVQQFLEYLENTDMGDHIFHSSDFEMFVREPSKDGDTVLRRMHLAAFEMVKTAIRATDMSNFRIERRDFDREYLGIDIAEFNAAKVSDVIHLSVGVERDHVRCYVVVEPKALNSNLLRSWRKKPTQFSRDLSGIIKDMTAIDGWIDPTANIYEKWFYIMGISRWHLDTAIPLKGEATEVELLMNRLSELHSHAARTRQLKSYYSKKNYPGRSVFGTFAIEYCFPAEYASHLEEDFPTRLAEAFRQLHPIYEFLKKEVS